MRRAITPREQWLNEVAEWEGKTIPFPTDPDGGVDDPVTIRDNRPIDPIGRLGLYRGHRKTMEDEMNYRTDLAARYHVVLENRLGCELDGRFASSEDDINSAVLSLVKDAVLAEGDVIRIREVA